MSTAWASVVKLGAGGGSSGSSRLCDSDIQEGLRSKGSEAADGNWE